VSESSILTRKQHRSKNQVGWPSVVMQTFWLAYNIRKQPSLIKTLNDPNFEC
jgi:hypothetical protein